MLTNASPAAGSGLGASPNTTLPGAVNIKARIGYGVSLGVANGGQQSVFG
jgi:hypothetical protein